MRNEFRSWALRQNASLVLRKRISDGNVPYDEANYNENKYVGFFQFLN